MPPAIFKKVDFPLPDLPEMATISLAPISRSMLRKAVNSPAGVAYDFETCRRTIMANTLESSH